MKVLITILFLSLFLSCNSREGVEITWKDYSIVGKVKILSEKIMYVKCNEDLTLSSDTFLNKLTFIQNRYFNKKGLITKFFYYDKDSVMTLKNEYVISKGEIVGANSTNIKENKVEKVEINKINENLFESKTFENESNKIISTAFTHRKNGFTFKQEFENKFSGRIQKTDKYYIRDESGLVTEIIDTTRIDNQLFTTKTLVKYSEYDNRNNWTKKIEYHGDTICRITLRKLEYY